MLALEVFQDGIITSVQEFLFLRFMCLLVATGIAGTVDDAFRGFRYGMTLPRSVNVLFFLFPFHRRLHTAAYALQLVNFGTAIIGVILSLFVNDLPFLFFVLNVFYGIAFVIGNTVLCLDLEMNQRDAACKPLHSLLFVAFMAVGIAFVAFNILYHMSWFR